MDHQAYDVSVDAWGLCIVGSVCCPCSKGNRYVHLISIFLIPHSVTAIVRVNALPIVTVRCGSERNKDSLQEVLRFSDGIQDSWVIAPSVCHMKGILMSLLCSPSGVSRAQSLEGGFERLSPRLTLMKG